MKRLGMIVVLTVGLLVYAGVNLAQPGNLDPTFGTNGKVTIDFGSTEYAYSAAIQPDGKIVVAGGESTTGVNADFLVARLNTNGSLDTGFDTDGKVTSDFGTNVAVARSVIIQTLTPNVKIVVAGGYGDFALARYGNPTVIVGVGEIDFASYITLRPNPTAGEFILSMELTKPEELEIKVVNVSGQVVYEEKINRFSGKYEKVIDLNKHSKGIYILKLKTNEDAATKKLIIQ